MQKKYEYKDNNLDVIGTIGDAQESRLSGWIQLEVIYTPPTPTLSCRNKRGGRLFIIYEPDINWY